MNRKAPDRGQQDGQKGQGGFGRRSKYQRVNAHREAAQFNGVLSGRPASACGEAVALGGPPDRTFFISAIFSWRGSIQGGIPGRLTRSASEALADAAEPLAATLAGALGWYSAECGSELSAR